MLSFECVMSVFFSPWQQSVENMQLTGQYAIEKRLIGNSEQFIKRWHAWTAVAVHLP